MNRRQFLASSAIALTSTSLLGASAATSQRSSEPAPTTTVTIPDDLLWHDVREWGVEGRAFSDTENYFDRLPARAKSIVRKPLWDNSRHTAGMSVRFESATDSIYVRYELLNESLAMPHMPATGVSGLDLYALIDNHWHYAQTLKPAKQSILARLVGGLDPTLRAYQINFPLYNGVKSFQIAVPKGAKFKPIPPRNQKPILFYGTSVTQGGCASRPGMAFLSILGRRLDRPTLNFGFSGQGRMETDVAQFLAELDPAINVLDCMANMGPSIVPDASARIEAVVRLLRKSHPDTPILILEARPQADEILIPRGRAIRTKQCQDFRAAYENLLNAGLTNLHYRQGDDLIGTDGEATVDASHPTDLGMMRYADALEPDLRKLL